MCHSVTWYHTLCGHVDNAMSTLIYCDDAIYTGTDCLPYANNIDIPVIGLCEECIIEKNRERTARPGLELQSKEEHAPLVETQANEATTTDTNIQSQETSIRYDTWNNEYEPNTDEPYGLRITYTNEMVWQWLNNPVSPVPLSPGSMSSYDDSPQPMLRNRHSYIPVPMRMIRPKTQPSTQRSDIPIPIRMLQKTTWESTRPLGAIGMRLFDRITL
ncbi:hypothetical protein N7448_001041 [Penicillium atrosanguineum]|uniref:uncharacterized protein n=1 Tax=Penicillium atrosanguineum TaxID=1132637 RepID=UPI00238B56CF|nr:uncharacterized protein N7443_004438 [Penicillium atrosanguineum]KAJ5149463.1 hypothetical protein N7448_001041 [Penicillium atrosanguineum]KAJ5304778.1 hypothetical protein N7443_004438 [Penicillium atrosanguineum]